MRYKGKELTLEQEENLKQILTGKDYALQAPPGSGKTFSLLATARKMSGNGLNLSFNKALAIQASQNFSRNVLCKTGHSLAYGFVGWKYKDRLKKITGAVLASDYDIGDHSLFRTPSYKGYLILGCIQKYCYSSDSEINDNHLPFIPVADISKLSFMQEDLIVSSRKIVSLMFDLNSNMAITHDVYLKKWALSNPQLKKDFILFDEYQDANPVISQVVHNQKNTQKIFVGDQFQQIYSWRGAVNALSNSPLPMLYITKSFRFGEAIADLANKIILSYYPEDVRYKKFSGNENINSKISFEETPVDCIICRTNNGVINETIKAYKNNLSVYILGGVQQLTSLIQGIEDLKFKGKSYHPELFLFDGYQEFKEYLESPFGGDMKPVVKMIEKHGKEALLSLLNKTKPNEEKADVIITTAHKAKGLEWERIRLANDFKGISENDELPTPEEVNILYVAATRALKTIDISSCQALAPSMLAKAKKINEQNAFMQKRIFENA